MPALKQKRLLPYYGANTENAATVGKLLAGRSWVGIPFCGGMSEVKEIKASTIVVNDRHSHVINLCHVLRNEFQRSQLVAMLDATAFHPHELARAQQHAPLYDPVSDGMGNVQFAHSYYVSQWMGRSGDAGTDREFTGKISTRTNANGGDSNKRFRSAAESLDAWAEVMRCCNFSCYDFREWFEVYNGDTNNHAIFADPPWVKEGLRYKHPFAEQDHRDLASILRGFQSARVVVRYADHPLVRELYEGWEFRKTPSRNQGNNMIDEVLITPPRML